MQSRLASAEAQVATVTQENQQLHTRLEAQESEITDLRSQAAKGSGKTGGKGKTGGNKVRQAAKKAQTPGK